MPMVFDEHAFADGMGAVYGAGKGFCAMGTDFFENGRLLVHGGSFIGCDMVFDMKLSYRKEESQ